jgi:hypothetical protein
VDNLEQAFAPQPLARSSFSAGIEVFEPTILQQYIELGSDCVNIFHGHPGRPARARIGQNK